MELLGACLEQIYYALTPSSRNFCHLFSPHTTYSKGPLSPCHSQSNTMEKQRGPQSVPIQFLGQFLFLYFSENLKEVKNLRLSTFNSSPPPTQ